jgi:acyl-CoA dehydrogenase
MDFALTDDQLNIQKAVRETASRFTDEYWREIDESHEFPWDFYNAFAEAGWLGIAIPEEFGGGGLGIAEAGLLLEEVAASGAAMNGCSPLHLTIFGLNTVVAHGSDEMRKDVLPKAVNGDVHVCFAVTEPDSGTDTSRVRTFAKREGDGYRINGRKVWITKAAQSQKMVLVCRTADREDGATKPTDGISLFLIDIDPERITMNAIPKMGRNAVQSYQVFIDDLWVPESARIGEEGQGFRYLLDGLNPERVLLSHESLGIGRVSLSKASAYANEREVFGRPIGKNQGLAFPLAEAHIRLNAAQLMARKAATLYDAGEKCGAEANMAKFLCADAAFTAADQAVQTLGGMGYAREYDVERYFREARLMRIAPVSQEMALNFIAVHELGLPKSY